MKGNLGTPRGGGGVKRGKTRGVTGLIGVLEEILDPNPTKLPLKEIED